MSPAPTNVDEYIATFPPAVQAILRKVRQTVRAAAPEAREIISYRMPALRQHGVLVYFAAFKKHIGLVSADQRRRQARESGRALRRPEGQSAFPAR